MSLYDRLTNQIGDDDEPRGGLTPLDIADLPAAQRKVMFSLLRDTKAATEGITRATLFEKLDAPDDFEETLNSLVTNGWLIAVGEEDSRRYKVNIRRKRSSSLSFGIWSSLSERITAKMESMESDTPSPKLPDAFSSQGSATLDEQNSDE
ncbi:MAG: hypothetical protein L0154_04210 [Chloroflexi bacterium]|nr:hypothetical protein [Chloroflexota bacterium]